MEPPAAGLALAPSRAARPAPAADARGRGAGPAAGCMPPATSALVRNNERKRSDQFIDHLRWVRRDHECASRRTGSDETRRSDVPVTPPTAVGPLARFPSTRERDAVASRPFSPAVVRTATRRRGSDGRPPSTARLGPGPHRLSMANRFTKSSVEPRPQRDQARACASTRRPIAAASDGGGQLLSCSTISQPAVPARCEDAKAADEVEAARSRAR